MHTKGHGVGAVDISFLAPIIGFGAWGRACRSGVWNRVDTEVARMLLAIIPAHRREVEAEWHRRRKKVGPGLG